MHRTARVLLIACVLTHDGSEAESGPAGEFLQAQSRAQQVPADPDTFRSGVLPFLAKHCTPCHGPTRPKAGLDLSALREESTARARRRVWERIRENVEAGLMPPEDRPQPSREEIDRLTRWIRVALRPDDCGGVANPGRVTIRRLNRAEYNNTVRDLLGIDFRPADDFPADEVGCGFDNLGDVLSLPPLLMEKYLSAAATISARALARPGARGSEPTLPESYRRIMIREPRSPGEIPDAARAILERFATRAYRRPVTDAEVAQLLHLVDLAVQNGDPFERGIQLAIQAVLVSPHFLFRVELDSGPSRLGEADAPGDGIEPIGEFELASRLSYFLWSSMPDDELVQSAAEGRLRSGESLTREVRRMLQDPKARALVENFAGQWLQIRNLKSASPDRDRFPAFDEPLRAAMLRESELFFAEVMRDDRSILDFLDADFTYVNERLARHYGLTGIFGAEFRRVRLSESARGGLVTQASILTVTSNPNRTSPVKRGKWVLEQLLGAPIPPPPPGVPDLSEAHQGQPAASLRRRMEQHRANPSCAACHNRLDPLGFGLENYDGIGAWRETEGPSPIDASGTFPGGESFRGPGELKRILKAHAREFARCLAEKMLTYALGRRLEDDDRCAIVRIVKELEANQYRFSTLVLGIVTSDPFLKRRVDRAGNHGG